MATGKKVFPKNYLPIGNHLYRLVYSTTRQTGWYYEDFKYNIFLGPYATQQDAETDITKRISSVQRYKKIKELDLSTLYTETRKICDENYIRRRLPFYISEKNIYSVGEHKLAKLDIEPYLIERWPNRYKPKENTNDKRQKN